MKWSTDDEWSVWTWRYPIVSKTSCLYHSLRLCSDSVKGLGHTFRAIRVYVLKTVHWLRFRYLKTELNPTLKRWRQQWIWRMPSSGMWRRVGVLLTDVSEERIASIVRVEAIHERWTSVNSFRLSDRRYTQLYKNKKGREGGYLGNQWRGGGKGLWSEGPACSGICGYSVYSYLFTLVHRSWITSTLKMEGIRSSETSVNRIPTRRHIPKDGILHSHRRENIKSHNNECVLCESSWTWQ
jgi:hypothetical protein